MDLFEIHNIIRQLNDTELAALICLVAEQHCIIRAPHKSLLKLLDEVRHIVLNTFGLTCASIECGAKTTLESFSAAVIIDNVVEGQNNHLKDNDLDDRKAANVVIAKDLDLASHAVQILALEFIRSKRIYSTKAAHAAPKRFLFIALIASEAPGPPYLTSYLNDRFFISYLHDTDAPSSLVDSSLSSETASVSSQASIVRRKPSSRPKFPDPSPVISDTLISSIQKKMAPIRLPAEIRRYAHNLVTFMRLHHAVAGGISAVSSTHLVLMTQVLAPLHGLSYVTPSLVVLAARKVFPHRIEITAPEHERSMQWGSDLDAVKELLENVTPGIVIEDTIDTVEAPL